MPINIVEYVWIDAFSKLRSKARTLNNVSSIFDVNEWSYDASSCGQADTLTSEMLLIPRALFKDPFRGSGNYIAMCDCYDLNLTPIESNNRYGAKQIFDKYQDADIWFGLEQEYFVFDKTNFDDMNPQGPYYCGVGNENVCWRNLIDEHYKLCLEAGLKISGINIEVAPNQFEFQVGICRGIEAGDHLWIARYILLRLGEKYGVDISFHPKPLKGNWNGSGMHCNVSTLEMRNPDGLKVILECMPKLANKHKEHLLVYGDNSERLSGHYETSNPEVFTFGVSDRSCSVRIPYTTDHNKCGYFEDRRPASDADPYLVTSMICKTIMED